jgi:hypothetical protein
MRLYASADLSAPNAPAGEKRGEIAAHKYEGLTSFQRTIPRKRTNCGDTAACRIIDVRSEIWRSVIGQKKRAKGTISAESHKHKRQKRVQNALVICRRSMPGQFKRSLI